MQVDSIPPLDVPSPDETTIHSGFDTSRYFIENRGQKGPGAGAFYHSGGKSSIALGMGWVSYLVHDIDGTKVLVRVSFQGANHVEPVGMGFTGHENNFFIGDDPDQWVTGARSYRWVVYDGLWEGIDLRFGFHEGLVKYEYILHPGSDPANIMLDVEGHEAMAVVGDDMLTISTAAGPISDRELIAFYREDPGELIPCGFDVRSPGSYGFSLGDFDKERTVVIDPLIYSTLLNGEWNDDGRGLDVDTNGSAYVVGRTYSDQFPVTPGVYKPSKANDDRIYDGFVTKMSPHGTSLVYSTFLGGNKLDVTTDIFIDPNGTAYILGWTESPDFPVTEGAYHNKTVEYGSLDLFLTKLDPSGSSLVYSLTIGGNDRDHPNRIVVDNEGCAFITGEVNSWDYPITIGKSPPKYQDLWDQAVISKFSANGSELLASRFLGLDTGFHFGGIDVDEFGDVFICGATRSPDWPTTPGTLTPTVTPSEIFKTVVSKLSGDLSTFLISTYLYDKLETSRSGIHVADGGYIYIVGTTRDPAFPTTPDAYKRTFVEPNNAYVLKMTPKMDDVLFSSFLFQVQERQLNIDVDSDGNIYIAGGCKAGYIPVTPDSVACQPGGQNDAFVAFMTTNATDLAYASYVAGAHNDYINGIVVDVMRNVYVAGYTESPDFPITSGSISTNVTKSAVFVLKFGPRYVDETAVEVEDGPILYSRYRAYDFRVDTNPTRSVTTATTTGLILDPGGAGVALRWSAGRAANPFFIDSDPKGLVELVSGPDDVERDWENNTLTLHFRVLFDWTWPHESPCDAVVETVNFTGGSSLFRTRNLFSVENDLQLYGGMHAETARGVLEENGWVGVGENITAWGPVVVYQGTTDKHPPPNSCSVVLMDDDGDRETLPSMGTETTHVTIRSDPVTDLDETLRMMLDDVPGDVVHFQEPSFRVRVDGEVPSFTNPIPSDDDWHSSSQVLVAITADDSATSGVDASTLEYSYSIPGTGGFTEWSRNGLETTQDGPTVDGLVTIDMPDGDMNFVRWRVKDLMANGFAVSDHYRVKVDTQNVTYSDFDPEGWQLRLSLSTGVVIHDTEGSGIDASSIQYRVSNGNLSAYGAWMEWDDSGVIDQMDIEANVDLVLAETPFNYIQWRAIDIAGNGYTTSPHHRISTDVTPISWSDFTPLGTDIQNTSSVSCWITVTDGPLGSGVSLSSIEVRYLSMGEVLADWTSVGMEGFTATERFSLRTIELMDGATSIEFRGTDLAGNGPNAPSEHELTVDTTGPEIFDVVVSPMEGGDPTDYRITARVRDVLAGVDLGSSMYRVDVLGVGHPQGWQRFNLTEGREWLSVDLHTTFHSGILNTIELTVSDMVGNRVVVKGPSTWVNTPPVAMISSPPDKSEWPERESLPLSGLGSSDPDGQPLDYHWTYTVDLSGSDPVPCCDLAEGFVELTQGNYTIRLTVIDSNGSMDVTSVQLTILPGPPMRTENTGTPFIWLILILLILGCLGAAAVLIQRRSAQINAPDERDNGQ